MSIKPKTTLQLYRDCLRLVKHIAGDSPKATHLRSIVGAQFRKNKDETDERKIHDMKQSAERALSNYFLFEHVQKDQKFEKFRKQSEEDVAAAHQVLVDHAQGQKRSQVDEEADVLEMREASDSEAEGAGAGGAGGEASPGVSDDVLADILSSFGAGSGGEADAGSDHAAPWEAGDDSDADADGGAAAVDDEVDSLFDEGEEKYGELADSDAESDSEDERR
uniref:Complex 1 LYR protein domain-containing protein n=1 Tax=Bicosoecida sp. CB-2014 TaxID=1486930 RepID=A0A7S1CKJ3_9STRA|mmetsp:Transcript_27690/g.95804  ORF Transcript_27690/g.95804 Transcript_27690/m.95804 type:complete len:221 (+) Transcript_27690:44-706(+)|eukprot:CAMPEP_0203808620 /NCGR_PEP_ID=MMETSP0115-20131106/1720_1 /ASSEMBLY_ACC=CAM_ASM_000227 /TAXON_ID=33651 /ORGANISM="Bicosoecid sp, Strain ms1" /LENGTH=220 /DNA_ID=CAMNT_0050717311 /DNA_START=37 /DNA_END=699 /DNA_ORIENTATION=+